MAQHNDLGKQGEQEAIKYLKANGYFIKNINYRYRKAEIDIIASKGETLAIIEVKTRTGTAFGNPEDFVNKKKIQLLIEATDHYVTTYDLDVEVRFDIISILHYQGTFTINHIKEAFLPF